MSDRYTRNDPAAITIAGDGRSELRNAVADYLRSLAARNYSARTIELRQPHLADFATWLLGRGLDSPHLVTPAVLEDYRLDLHSAIGTNGRPRAVSTQAQRLTAIRMLFRHLARAKRIPSDPAIDLDLPRLPQPLPHPAFTASEAERILAQPDLRTRLGVRDRAIMEVLFATGIRRRELAWLRIDDIDHEQRDIAVRHAKGGRARVVPISERALGWLDRYLAVRPTPRTPDDARTLFLTFEGTMCGLVGLSSTVSSYVRDAGITKRGGCHTFRATTATLMLEGGADIRFVQEMLGHAKITTTQRYARISIGALHDVYARTHPSALANSEPLPAAFPAIPHILPHFTKRAHRP